MAADVKRLVPYDKATMTEHPVVEGTESRYANTNEKPNEYTKRDSNSAINIFYVFRTANTCRNSSRVFPAYK